MKPTLQISNSAQLRFTVTPQMQPQFGEKAIHPVCSTWDMAHQFEIVARQTLEPHLEDGEEGTPEVIGTEEVSEETPEAESAQTEGEVEGEGK